MDKEILQTTVAENTGGGRASPYTPVGVRLVVLPALVGFAGGPTPEEGDEDQI